MKISRKNKYTLELQAILRFIAYDKISASKQFKQDLDKQITNIPNFPYKHRQSIYFDDANVRDMIFRGYTINYEIDLEKNTIFVISIFNQNKPN